MGVRLGGGWTVTCQGVFTEGDGSVEGSLSYFFSACWSPIVDRLWFAFLVFPIRLPTPGYLMEDGWGTDDVG